MTILLMSRGQATVLRRWEGRWPLSSTGHSRASDSERALSACSGNRAISLCLPHSWQNKWGHPVATAQQYYNIQNEDESNVEIAQFIERLQGDTCQKGWMCLHRRWSRRMNSHIPTKDNRQKGRENSRNPKVRRR